jgi:hypothetical protein
MTMTDGVVKTLHIEEDMLPLSRERT